VKNKSNEKGGGRVKWSRLVRKDGSKEVKRREKRGRKYSERMEIDTTLTLLRRTCVGQPYHV